MKTNRESFIKSNIKYMVSFIRFDDQIYIY